MSKEQLKEVRHDYIRYANCWEDADVLRAGLKLEIGDRVLSIGSAGDNSFSLLVDHPELVVAVDINAVQLNLIELKKGAFKALFYEEFLAFLGFSESENRLTLFEKVKECLPKEVADFWNGRKDEIKNGIIYQGKFENYFQAFRTKVLPLIHSQKRIDGLFDPKGAKGQKQYFDTQWDSWRWRALFKVFFSSFVMGRLGRDPQFLKEVEVPVSTFILAQAAKHLSSVNCQDNYFLNFILKGTFGDHLPHFARRENFETIKARIDRVEVYNGLAEAAFKDYKGFNRFNLSNIFEYMDPKLFQAVAQNLMENGEAGSRYAYWNLMVPRRMSSVLDELQADQELSEQLTAKDKGFFYGNFLIDTKGQE